MYIVLPADYTHTPTPMPPTPRRVGYRRGVSPGAGLWGIRLFVLPHTLVGLGALLVLPLYVLWALYGQDVAAPVTSTYVTESKKGGTTHWVKYTLPGSPEVLTGSVSAEEFLRLNGPDLTPPPPASTNPQGGGPEPAARPEYSAATIQVRSFVLGPFHHEEIEDGHPWSEVGGILFFALFWNGIMGAVLYKIWIVPLRIRALYSSGSAADGQIIKLRKKENRNTTYWIDYDFEDPTTFARFSGTVECFDLAAANQAQIGDELTVLYSPRNPKRSTAYEYGMYQLRDELPPGMTSLPQRKNAGNPSTR